MTSIEEIGRAWNILESTPSTSDSLTVREIEFADLPHGQPLFAIDSEKRRHLLIPISIDSRIVEDKQSAGVHLLANEWVDGIEQKRFADLICVKPHLNRLFDLILAEVFESITSDTEHPDRVIRKILTRWRELINQAPSELPSLSEIIGLFGEMWLLRELARFDARVVSLWVGPFGARHDLYNGKSALEVKSTILRSSKTITIHGHEQLQVSAGDELFLCFLRLEQLPTGGETISDLLEALISIGCDQLTLLKILGKQGLTIATLEELNSFHFRLLETRIYRVDDSFPRIVTTSFKEDRLPTGVISLEYNIDLATEPPFPLPEGEVSTFYQQFVEDAEL